jgi:hypothetical protein
MTDSGTEETGLNLIHDTASAAGTFPHSVWGYDRQTVDTYVQELEQQLSAAKQLIRHMQREVAASKRTADASDFTKLGDYTAQMLQAAEGQSRELLDQANQEAERIKAEARRLAAEARAGGEQEADDIRLNAQGTFKRMRAEVDVQCAKELDRAREQANSILESSRTQSEHQLAETSRASVLKVEAAEREAELILQRAATQAAEVRLAAEKAREQVLSTLSQEQEAAAQHLMGLLEKSRAETEANSQRLQDEISEAAELRRKALAESEEIKVTAVREAEVQIAQAHAQASLLRDRAEEQLGWRTEQLKRETNRLEHRKQAIVAQLANLSALAEQSLAEFPDLLGLSDPVQDETDPSATEPTAHVPYVPEDASEQAEESLADEEPAADAPQATEPAADPDPQEDPAEPADDTEPTQPVVAVGADGDDTAGDPDGADSGTSDSDSAEDAGNRPAPRQRRPIRPQVKKSGKVSIPAESGDQDKA